PPQRQPAVRPRGRPFALASPGTPSFVAVPGTLHHGDRGRRLAQPQVDLREALPSLQVPRVPPQEIGERGHGRTIQTGSFQRSGQVQNGRGVTGTALQRFLERPHRLKRLPRSQVLLAELAPRLRITTMLLSGA